MLRMLSFHSADASRPLVGLTANVFIVPEQQSAISGNNVYLMPQWEHADRGVVRCKERLL